MCTAAGAEGLIATNTTLARDGIAPAEADLAAEAGGLSGAPLTVRARQVVALPGRADVAADHRGRRHHDRATTARPCWTPGPACCRSTPGSSTPDPPWSAELNRLAPACRSGEDRMTTAYGDPAGRRVAAERGPLCVGIDPHPGILQRLGPEPRRRRAGALRPRHGRGAGRDRGGVQAAVGVLRGVRVGRDRGARADPGRHRGGRRAVAAGREARRHRLAPWTRTPPRT